MGTLSPEMLETITPRAVEDSEPPVHELDEDEFDAEDLSEELDMIEVDLGEQELEEVTGEQESGDDDLFDDELFAEEPELVNDDDESGPSDDDAGEDAFDLSGDLENYESQIEGITKPTQTDENDPELPRNRRQFPRTRASFLVKIQDMKQLQQFFSRDVSVGGMFLKTSQVVEIGTPINLVVIHPWTGIEYIIDAAVRRIEKEGVAVRGLGVEFSNMNTTERQQFLAFIESGFNLKEYDANDTTTGAKELLADIDSKIAKNPINPELHYKAGLVHYFLNELDQAKEHLDISAKLGFPIPDEVKLIY